MTRHEFIQWFDTQVQPRWSTWPVNACIIGDWYEVFGRYSSASLTEAVRRHKIRDDPARPKISVIRAILRAQTHGQGSETSEPSPAFFIQCVEPPANHPNRVCRSIPIHVRSTPGFEGPDALAACAERVRQKYERLYGGRWISILKKDNGGQSESFKAAHAGQSAETRQLVTGFKG